MVLTPSIPSRRPASQPAGGAAEAARSNLQRAEAEYKSQLDALKAAAGQANADALSAAAAAASTSGRLPADGAAAGPDAGLRARLEAAVQAMQAGLVERDTEVRLLLLAALSGEHILYIGWVGGRRGGEGGVNRCSCRRPCALSRGGTNRAQRQVSA